MCVYIYIYICKYKKIVVRPWRFYRSFHSLIFFASDLALVDAIEQCVQLGTRRTVFRS